jgi:hypothetical protein
MTPILTIAVLLFAAALQAQGPDPLIYASAQAARAHKLFEECAYAQALERMQRAIRHVENFQSSQPRERDTAAALLARLEFEREELQRRRRQLDAAARQLEPLLRAGLLETLRSQLSALSPPPCDARFQSLEQRAEARAAQAAALVRSGDEQLRQLQADRALKLYLQAQQLNRQHAGLEERIARARAWKPRGRAAAIVGKTILTTIVVAGIGYAGYWTYRTYKERGPNSTPAAGVRFVPPPTYRSFGGQR